MEFASLFSKRNFSLIATANLAFLALQLPSMPASACSSCQKQPTGSARGKPVELDERLFLKADSSVIVAIASANPEAANVLHILSLASMTPHHPLPMVGDTLESGIATEASVLEFIREGSSNESVLPLKHKIKQKDALSRTDWKVTKGEDSAVIELTHGVFDTNNRKLETLYPDIKVDLMWVAAKQGGYWSAKGWNVRQ